MLNFFFLYAAVWGAVFLLYSLGWSSLCTPLAPGVQSFFIVTILCSLLLGTVFRKAFRFRALPVCPRRRGGLTLLIVTLCFAEFAYCGQIPLLSILTGRADYLSYTGIPTFHPLLITCGVFYEQYLFYLFLCFPRKKGLLLEYLALVTAVQLLQYNRGGIVICATMSGLMLLSKLQSRIRLWHVLAVGVFGLGLLYGFGVFGNLRCGFAWNDCRYIAYIGQFDRYPEWLPRQFMWGYIYIVSPMANLNHNVLLGTARSDLLGYLSTFLPDFISRRLFPQTVGVQAAIIREELNATAGFDRAYLFGGVVGMYGMYAYLAVGLLLAIWAVRRSPLYRVPTLAICASIAVFLFFAHTISYSAISFPIVYPLLLSLFRIRSLHKDPALMPEVRCST